MNVVLVQICRGVGAMDWQCGASCWTSVNVGFGREAVNTTGGPHGVPDEAIWSPLIGSRFLKFDLDVLVGEAEHCREGRSF